MALNQGGFAIHGHLTVPGGRPFGLYNLRCSWHLTEARDASIHHPMHWAASATAKTSAVWQRNILTGMVMSSMQCIVENWNRQMLLYLYIFEHTNIWRRTAVFENHQKYFLLLLRFSSAHFFSKKYILLKSINIFGREIKNEVHGNRFSVRALKKMICGTV